MLIDEALPSQDLPAEAPAAAQDPALVREVPTYFVPRVLEKIAKANRKAAKLGAPGFTAEVGEPYELIRTEDGPAGLPRKVTVSMTRITIKGETFRVGGFQFIGRVDFEDGVTIVNARPGEELPVRFRTTDQRCEHCDTLRARNSVFVFRRAGTSQYIQVGRNCVADFAGINPAGVLWAAESVDELSSDIDSVVGVGYGSPCESLDKVMTMAAAVIRVCRGYVSRSAAERSERLVATSSMVYEQLFQSSFLKAHQRIDITEEDEARAALVLAWAREQFCCKEGQNDYEYNVGTLLGRDYINTNRLGVVISVFGAYARAMQEGAQFLKVPDAYVGAVKQRREFEVTYLGCSYFDTMYGRMYVVRLGTPEGLLVYKGSSISWLPDPVAEGATLKVKATIKEHAEYQGKKQTLIARVAAA